MAGTGGKRPGAGRPKGSKSKRTYEAMAILDALGVNPIENLARIAAGHPIRAQIGLNKDNGDIIVEDVIPTLEQQLAANKELAQYVAPKLKAIEHSGTDGGAIIIEKVSHAKDSDSK